ncbi:hypothetical protein GBL_2314 [Geobacillus kaustophilus GBlys]|uniref:Uncharacterized protein n=1 Tax=Geobacillus kaustophilus GBlys TaxID=1337888 RepID=U2X5Q9_GEOKU|nr:hypothetical protein GBL_2314 [Geobacillus kaustophilus GBlys]
MHEHPSMWEMNVGRQSLSDRITCCSNGHLRNEGKRKGSLCGLSFGTYANR